MPKLIRLYIRQVLAGFGISAVFVTLLMWLNVMGLWTLISSSDAGLIAVFMLWFMNGIVFAGVQFAWSIMALAENDNDDDRHGGTPVAHEFRPIPVPADKSRGPL